MASPVLLDAHIEAGRRFVQACSRQFEVAAAFWAYDDEAEDWRLFVATSLLKRLSAKEVYKRAYRATEHADLEVDTYSLNVTLVKPDHPLVVDLRDFSKNRRLAGQEERRSAPLQVFQEFYIYWLNDPEHVT
jgi:hypothetical protein